MKPETRVRCALATIIVTLIAWPLSMFTFAKDEPPFVLSLSWLAITLTAVDVLATSHVSKEQDEDDS